MMILMVLFRMAKYPLIIFTAQSKRAISPQETIKQLEEKANEQYLVLIDKDCEIESLQRQVKILNEMLILKEKKNAIHEKHIGKLNSLIRNR